MGSGSWVSGGMSSRFAPRARERPENEEQEDSDRPRLNELRSGQGYHFEDEDERPRFLVHTDDAAGGADFGEDRLVAPPVIGEGPVGYGF
ncbi:hypothetical protein [Actinopolyspora mortivallis]|nr:hypothetical protein [Actinopolyspora mortivallis]